MTITIQQSDNNTYLIFLSLSDTAGKIHGHTIFLDFVNSYYVCTKYFNLQLMENVKHYFNILKFNGNIVQINDNGMLKIDMENI